MLVIKNSKFLDKNSKLKKKNYFKNGNQDFKQNQITCMPPVKLLFLNLHIFMKKLSLIRYSTIYFSNSQFFSFIRLMSGGLK